MIAEESSFGAVQFQQNGSRVEILSGNFHTGENPPTYDPPLVWEKLTGRKCTAEKGVHFWFHEILQSHWSCFKAEFNFQARVRFKNMGLDWTFAGYFSEDQFYLTESTQKANTWEQNQCDKTVGYRRLASTDKEPSGSICPHSHTEYA